MSVPPPVRRIRVEEAPTVVPPPAGGNGHGPAGQPAPQLRRMARAETVPVERMRTEELSIAYGSKLAVDRVSLSVRQGEVLALIGPSGCGKTTLLRSLNRLVDLTPGAVRGGRILLDGEDVDLYDATFLRRRVGMLFQQPNPFPMSIFDNVAYGLRERGSKKPAKRELEPAVSEALHRAGLFEEVKDNLDHPALALSGGQQQRLCIARSLAVRPEVLLLDEPCSALDPISTQTIEETIVALRSEIAIVIVTHNLQQAQRVADHVAFMYLGEMVEYGEAAQVFSSPVVERTREYVSGGFG
ncbi:MAG TPA: phosphate ABC transporter ATP-binding protein [Solirubrobacterales bacterium]|jgi:phosphate transport system ATP-binding protein|nr:phosphate ABC transporter ATP-binding protein [Solirubrobacterales bacterium]